MKQALRQLIKGIPGARWAYRTFVLTPGGWMFSRRNLEWMLTSDVARRLPMPFRLFAAYCRSAPVRRGKVFGGETLHSIVSRLTHALGTSDEFCIEVEGLAVYLLLTDPRAILVPGEVARAPEIILLRKLLNEGDTFIDVGANHGSFSIVASKAVGNEGLVVAIEPQPKLAALVEKTLRHNACSRFEVHCVACAESPGRAQFFVPRATSGSAGLHRAFSAVSSARTYDVELVRLDQLVSWKSLSSGCVVKIDVEGAELQVLKGATDALSLHGPPLIMEINRNAMTGAGYQLQDLVETLDALGYRHYREIDDPRSKELGCLDDRQRNVVFFAR